MYNLQNLDSATIVSTIIEIRCISAFPALNMHRWSLLYHSGILLTSFSETRCLIIGDSRITSIIFSKIANLPVVCKLLLVHKIISNEKYYLFYLKNTVQSLIQGFDWLFSEHLELVINYTKVFKFR